MTSPSRILVNSDALLALSLKAHFDCSFELGWTVLRVRRDLSEQIQVTVERNPCHVL